MTDIVQYQPTPIDTERLGSILVKSGFFKDTTDQAQAIVKILYGGEQGFPPIASMMGVYVVQGKPSLSAQLIAAAIQKSGIFNYRVREWTDELCRIEFFERNESVGDATFSMKDAARAKLVDKDNWKHFPRSMLWARAMSQGARAYCPSIFNGAIYSVEELHDEPNIVDTVNGQVDTKTGEVLEQQEEPADEDMVQSVDDEPWKAWLKVEEVAKKFGLTTEEIKLPVHRADLKAYAQTVIQDIKEREAVLTDAGR